MDHYVAHLDTSRGYAFLELKGRALICFNAFLVMSLLNSNYVNQEGLLKELADGIIASQKADGSYQTDFLSQLKNNMDYYPGEAMLSLMKIYLHSKDKAYKDSVEKAFPFYRNYWRHNKNTAFIPWQTETYLLLYKENHDPELTRFVFEMNDWLIDNFQINKSKNHFEDGGLPKTKPRCGSTAVYLEGVSDAYAMAILIKDVVHTRKYADSLRSGVRFVLNLQVTDPLNFKNPKRALGGFKASLTSCYQRIDTTQHATGLLIKSVKNKLFL
jgi:hypothetical protein